jgi:molybdenum cofactor cytidylyltransferase
MPKIEDSVLVLLAAGRSTRFGAGRHKLHQELFGRPLGEVAAGTLAALPFRERVAVTAAGGLDVAALGFREVVNDDPEAGMAQSLALGVEAADRLGAAAVLVALADMPCVTAAHVERIFAAAGGGGVVASSDGHAAKPPALFTRDQFGRLKALSGDAGARALLRDAALVVAPADELVDVDTAEELERLRERLD